MLCDAQKLIAKDMAERFQAEDGRKKIVGNQTQYLFGEKVQALYLAEDKSLHFGVVAHSLSNIGMAIPVAGRVLGQMNAGYLSENISRVVLMGPGAAGEKNPEVVGLLREELLYVRHYANVAGGAAFAALGTPLKHFDELAAARRPFAEKFQELICRKLAEKASGLRLG